MHRLAALQHRLDAGLARAAYAAGSCPMPSIAAAWTVTPIFRVKNATKAWPRPLILSQ
jgi:hypothetical protein